MVTLKTWTLKLNLIIRGGEKQEVCFAGGELG